MKKFLLFTGLFLLVAFSAHSQFTNVFHENFELPSLADSLISSQNAVAGTNDYGINTRVFKNGLRSDSCQVKTGKTTYLTTQEFSTVGNGYVLLNFWHICKVDASDGGYLEYSINGGLNWLPILGAQYVNNITLLPPGLGAFANAGNKFASSSYGATWTPASAIALPNNTWWKEETFDLSLLIGNCPTAKIRFRLPDAGAAGPGGSPPNPANNKGWYIDNVLVKMAFSEMIAPNVAIVNPMWSNVTYSVGPYPVRVKASDLSGLSAVKLIYSVDNGSNDTVSMVYQASDTSWYANLPVLADSGSVCYYAIAYDASPSHNFASTLTTGPCVSFVYYYPFGFPFNDNFDGTLSLWEAGPASGTTVWERGVPNNGVTNSLHSPPNSWDINLLTDYGADANCTLLSPPLNFTGAYNARLSFWFNYLTEANTDGFRLEYTTNNGNTWTVLGSGPNPDPDPNGVNWYTDNSLNFTTNPGWEGNSLGWKQAKYRLSVLNNQTNFVRFRFVFLSNAWGFSDGVTIDDFSIVLPAPQEAAADLATAPSSGCGLGDEIVKVKFINMGLTPISSLTASYKRDASTPAVNELVTLSTPLAPGDTTLYTFTTPVNLSTVGANTTFNLKIWVTLTNDPNHGDDTTFRIVNSLYVPDPPLVTNASIGYGTTTTLTATSALPVTWYSSLTGGIQLGTGSTYTTTLLYGDTIFYAQVATPAPDNCVSARAKDTVFVSSPPPFDGSVLSIAAPVTGFNLQLPPNDSVKIIIRNYGTQPISGFQVKYIITGPLPTQNYAATFANTIQPGDIANYTFAVPVNVSTFGTYTIKSWLEVPGDLNQINDTATSEVINKMFVYCHSASTDGAPVDDNIGNITIGTFSNGVTTIPATSNPNSTANYTDYTNLPPIQVTKDQTYPFTVTAIYGGSPYSTITKVFVDWNWNGEFEEADETACTIAIPTAGPTYTGTANIYIPTTAHTGLTRFRVVLRETTNPGDVHACGTYTYGETEDYMVLISPQLMNDAGVTQITFPPSTYPENITSPVAVTIKNFGLNTLNSMNVSYKIDNNAAVTETYSGSLAQGQTTSYNFLNQIILPVGNHTINAWTTLPVLDSNAYNDTAYKSIYGIPISYLPYVDDFEDTINIQFTSSPATGTNWIYGAPTTTFPGSAHSPTHVWGTNLNISGGYTTNADCKLTTQLFYFENAINAKISFWMKRQIQNNDGAYLEYSIDNGDSWQKLGIQSDPNGINWYNGSMTGGDCWTGNVTNWVKVTYKLSLFNPPFSGNVRFRFNFKSDFGTNSTGFFIDDFQIFKPYQTDAGIDSIYTPNDPDAAGYPGHVKVRLNNFSSSILTSCPISYQLDNQAPVTQIWNGVLAPGDTIPFTFNAIYSIPQGDYCIKAYTSFPLDSAFINDTSVKCAFGIPVFGIPYDDHYDSVSNYWYTVGPQWERGTPSGTIINSPYSPANCWKTKINSIYSSVAQPDFLYSPMFDLTYGYDSITFYHWVDTYSGDKSWVDYLSINGQGEKEWKHIGSMGSVNGVNWYNSGSSGFINNGGIPGWHKSSYDLKILFDIANPVQFRFNFMCYYNNNWNPPKAGWAIDNFELTTPKIPQDAGIISIVEPVTSVTYGTDLIVKVRIKNFGTDSLLSIPVKYQINGTTVAAGNWTGILPQDSTVIFTFPAIASPLQSFDLCAYTDLPFDTKLDNDTSCKMISVVPPPLDVAITQIIEPVTMTIHGELATVKVRLTNFGYTPVSSVPLEYRVGDTVIVVNETWNGPALNQNEFIDYTFTQQYSYEYLGYYYLCALTKLPDDGYIANDTLCTKVEEKWTFIPENPESGLYMAQNYPNPCDAQTEIGYKVPGSGQVTFSLVNYLGQRLITKSEKVTQGEHKFIIDTSKLPQGLYYYYIEYDGKRMIQKMVVAH